MEENKKKLNILYINCHNQYTNFYGSIRDCKFCNVVYRYNMENLSLESYDAFIVSIDIFIYDELLAKKILEKIIDYNKPVIIVYSSDYNPDYKGLVYLKERFGINFEMKDAAILEDKYHGYLPDTDNGFALSMCSKKGIGKAYIKNTNNCFILRFDNISIIHDNKATFLNREKGVYYPKPELLQHLLNKETSNSIPDWIENIKVFGKEEISDEISEISESINNLQQGKNKLEEIIKNNNEYKKVLKNMRVCEIIEGFKMLNLIELITINEDSIKLNDYKALLQLQEMRKLKQQCASR